MNIFATKVEESSTIMNRYYINMHTMGFTTDEAHVHFETMAKEWPSLNLREICWLVCKSASQRFCRVPNVNIDS